MGVGLAATQLGILRRLLVFQAGPDSEPTALVNPEIEWLSDEAVVAEEGCLSLPRVSMDVERPLHARVSGLRRRRRAGRARGLGPRGAGAPARDRPPRRGPDPRPRQREQRKGALRALREGGSYSPPGEDETSRGRRRAPRAAHRRVRTVYLGTSEFAAAVLRRLAGSPHRPLLVVTPPDRRRGPRPQDAAAARRRGRAPSSGSSCCRPRTSTTRRRWSGSAPPRPRRSPSAPSAS